MERIVLAGIFALAASTTLAQTGPDTARAAGPANLCRELLAFMETPATAQATTPKPAGGSAATDSNKTATAKAGEPAPASQSGAGSSSSQEQTGQSGPATDAPDEKSAPAAATESSAQNAPQRSSVSAPVTKDPASTPKDSVLSVAEARDLAEAGDIAACQAAARELRIAGVAVPSPLLALTALDLKYQSAATEPQVPLTPAPPVQAE